MAETTRYARVQHSVAALRTSDGTHFKPNRGLVPATLPALFRAHHRAMAAALREQPRPGLFIFAAHHQWGLLGRLWLEATTAPRAGTIGRHDEVDLALPLDDALSLRHALFVVRRHEERVQFLAIDLQTAHGLQLESGQPMSMVEASGPLVITASDFVFFCFPTGAALPWDPDSDLPWGSLAPRLVSRSVPHRAPGSGPDVGRLEVQDATGMRKVALSASTLKRGALVGRYHRCDVTLPLHTVSRVHVVLLTLGGELYAIDAGSTNGTWCRARPVKMLRLLDGDPLALGEDTVVTWRTQW